MQRLPDETKLHAFLAAERRSGITGEWMSVVLLLLAAAVLLVGTYVAVFYVCFLVSPSWGLKHFHWVFLGYIAAVFFSYRNHDRERLTELKVGTLDGRPPWSVWIPGEAHMSNVNTLSPKTIGSTAKLITQIVFAIPGSLGAAWRAFNKARKLLRADIQPAVPVFAILLRKGKRVPYPELAAATAEPSAAISLLLLLNLAQHLPSEPTGMVILSSVRERLTGSA